MDHRSTTTTHLKNRKGKKERKESKSLHTGTESLVYTMVMDRFGKNTLPAHCTSEVACMRSLYPSRPTLWVLTAACASVGEKVLVQLTLISSAALTLKKFCVLVVALGNNEGSLNVFIVSFH